MDYLEKCNYCNVTPNLTKDGVFVCNFNNNCIEAVKSMERIKRNIEVSKDEIRSLVEEIINQKES